MPTDDVINEFREKMAVMHRELLAPEQPTAEERLDELLKQWHLCCYSYVKPGTERQFRVVLASSVLGRKLFGFGKGFAEALADAARQV